jgi:hypothetical protein
MQTSESNFKFTLCGRPGTCCPVVEQTSDTEYTITDDFGGSVKITQEQMALMQAVVDHAKTQTTQA